MSDINNQQTPQISDKWTTVVTATDGTKLLKRTIKVDDMNKAAEIAAQVANLIAVSDRADPVFIPT